MVEAAQNGIEVERLVRVFKGDIRAVDGIDLEVAPGEIYGFLGPNGAGKSTTVHMLTTLLPPTSGRAIVAGFDVVRDGPKVRESIGAALQEAALDPLLTGREHLRLQTALHDLPRAERGARTDELLERVGLTLAADRKVKGYSGGMKRRLDLALALVHRPRILFLDEPTTGLDPQSRTALWDEVGRLARDGRRHRLPDHAVPGGGRRPRRPRRDHRPRPHRRRGHAGAAQGRDRPADGRGACRTRPASSAAVAAVLERFGEPHARARRTRSPCGSSTARRSSPTSCARSTPRACAWRGSTLHEPTLDDVFLAKTGRSLEGAASEEEQQPAEPVSA